MGPRREAGGVSMQRLNEESLEALIVDQMVD